jgi:hypothetical protein
MDKFTKTTEIDISAMNEMEDETPKKSKVGTIVALIVCLFVSLFIWIFVMETDTSLIEKTYDDVSVTIVNNINNFDITAEDMSVIIKATRSDFADLKKHDISVILDASSITSPGKQNAKVMIKVNSVGDGVYVLEKNVQTIEIDVVAK